MYCSAAYFWVYSIIEEKKEKALVVKKPATENQPAGNVFVRLLRWHAFVFLLYAFLCSTSFFRFRALVAYAALWCATFKVPLLHSSLSSIALMCRGTVEGIFISSLNLHFITDVLCSMIGCLPLHEVSDTHAGRAQL
jgi:hypothetical protein